jgi:hypothetical protein
MVSNEWLRTQHRQMLTEMRLMSLKVNKLVITQHSLRLMPGGHLARSCLKLTTLRYPVDLKVSDLGIVLLDSPAVDLIRRPTAGRAPSTPAATGGDLVAVAAYADAE